MAEYFLEPQRSSEELVKESIEVSNSGYFACEQWFELYKLVNSEHGNGVRIVNSYGVIKEVFEDGVCVTIADGRMPCPVQASPAKHDEPIIAGAVMRDCN